MQAKNEEHKVTRAARDGMIASSSCWRPELHVDRYARRGDGKKLRLLEG